jgi:hypothetical protein
MKILPWRKLFVLVFFFSSLLAHAWPRTYVSVNGNDGNTGLGCPATAPCRSFGAALGVTNFYGEIVAVDSGDYPPVTITQSVTIKAAPGVDATIFSQMGDAITISAPGAGNIVVLRGLNVNGLNGGFSGIRFTAGGVLNVEIAPSRISCSPAYPWKGRALCMSRTPKCRTQCRQFACSRPQA